jgi:hypothetical protein
MWLLDQPTRTHVAVDLIFEMLKGRIGAMKGSPEHDGAFGRFGVGWDAAIKAVLDLLSKPEPPREPTLLEQYADVLCATAGHEHEGRPRCSQVPIAERLLALHDAAEHPLIKVPSEYPGDYAVRGMIEDRIRDHRTCADQHKHPNPDHGTLMCRKPWGHDGQHMGSDGLLEYRWANID